MSQFLSIRYEPGLKAYVVKIEGSNGALVAVTDPMDARRIAQGISAWTQLKVLDYS
jgi:hypothetical protein